MIRVEGLVKYFGAVHALDGLSLSVEPGAVYGFLGPNGAGKTTTLRILSGLARADRGQAWILDMEVGKPSADVRALVGVLPEEPAFYSWMTAREYLRDFVAPLFGIWGKPAALRADELLEIVGLADAANRRIGGFSRGMRQRLGLAQAMLHRPKVLLLDEPISALDPAGRKEVLDLIEALRGQTTVLLSTHILADVERVCDVIGIVSEGRMVTQENREALLARYALPLFEVEVENGFGNWLERIRQLPFVSSVAVTNSVARILVDDVHRAQIGLLESLLIEPMAVRRFEVVRPSLEDVFLRLTGTGEITSTRA
jgi:ABC-2 type transport system ATP-binding protein